MVSKIERTYSKDNWSFIDIQDHIFFDHFSSRKSIFSSVYKKYSFAVRRDILRLFHLCVSFDSRKEVLDWFRNQEAYDLNEIHLDLIDLFSYPEETIQADLDKLINESEPFILLDFICLVLDRALQWYEPSPSWPSDFTYILKAAKEVVDQSRTIKLKETGELPFHGVDLATYDLNSHLYYKLGNVCALLREELLYNNLKTMAIQAHLTLIAYMNIFFNYYASVEIDEVSFEREIENMIAKETQWCLSVLQDLKNQKANS